MNNITQAKEAIARTTNGKRRPIFYAKKYDFKKYFLQNIAQLTAFLNQSLPD